MRRAAIVSLLATSVLCGCVTIKPVDFSWPFESVLTADSAGLVKGEPKTIAFCADELFREETGSKDATAAGKTVRIIRDRAGYYFLTSPGFKRVYVFTGAEEKLVLKNAVLIAEQGMEAPFFNRRDQGIELVANGQAYLLNKDGIVPGGKK